MKTKGTLQFLAAMAFVGVFAACSNDDTIGDEYPYEISIARPAEFKVTSGGRTLAKTDRGRRNIQGETPELLYFKESECPDLYRATFPAQKLGKEECEHVYACIKEDAARIATEQAPIYEREKGSFTETAFYIVNAYSSKDHDAKGDHSNVAGDMHDLGINGVYIKEFNTNVCVSADLILAEEGLKDVTYDDSFGVKHETYTESNWKLFYIEDYGYYVGMDYGTNKFGYEPDGDYSDWVIKLIPAKKTEDPIDETNGSVEVNLSINDEHAEGDYIATKLSIHIRALTDVEILLPIDKAYYCEADDMNISLSHRDEAVIYKTEPKDVQMQIGGTTVTFTVQYGDEGIRITTDGVNEEVIEYCAEHYADGITFEVWNYFKDITRANLKPMLDRATVTFLDSNPKTYINAFGKVLPEFSTPIYNKFNEAGQLVPYTDPEFNNPLPQEFWTRVTEGDKDYVFCGVPNRWDCTVIPVEPAYKKAEKDYTDSTLPNYNVEYTL